MDANYNYMFIYCTHCTVSMQNNRHDTRNIHNSNKPTATIQPPTDTTNNQANNRPVQGDEFILFSVVFTLIFPDTKALFGSYICHLSTITTLYRRCRLAHRAHIGQRCNGRPTYVTWQNPFLGIDSRAPYTFTNSGSGGPVQQPYSYSVSVPRAHVGCSKIPAQKSTFKSMLLEVFCSDIYVCL